MNLSYVHKLLLAPDLFSAVRKDFREWRKGLQAKGGDPKRSRARHLTCNQREDIAAGLQDSTVGPISMTAAASDKEAVNYESEIANVLEETGFEVEIDNSIEKTPRLPISAGVEMIIKDETIRPIHAFRIVDVFRRAGLTIATRISALQRNNNTLYITVGPKHLPSAVIAADASTATAWRSKSMALLLEKWKKKFLI